jgi:hypothetical protein
LFVNPKKSETFLAKTSKCALLKLSQHCLLKPSPFVVESIKAVFELNSISEFLIIGSKPKSSFSLNENILVSVLNFEKALFIFSSEIIEA